MGLFSVRKFPGHSSNSMKERELLDKKLTELEENKLSAAAVENYALALKYKEEIAALHRNETAIVSSQDLDNPFKFPEEFDQDDDPEFLPEWVVKLPVPICWDESDDGVPPPCRGDVPVEFWKVFNHHNRFTNDNLVMIAFGNVGFKYFDKHRKFWMGLAMWSTLLSMSFTVAGCCALSMDKQIVINTNWVYIEGKDSSNGNVFTTHMGLRSLVYTDGPCTPLKCDKTTFPYVGNRPTWPNGFIQHGLEDCREVLNGTAFGAFTTCVTLIFALIGTINRMKFSSDANIQKALGMITDLCGFISLSITLFDVFSSCAGGIEDEYGNSIDVRVYMGPGYYCYVVCLFGAMMRAVFHWVTPLPGRGSGCRPRLPKSLLKKLDLHHDTQVSWDELRNAYRQFVKRHHEEKRHRKEKHALEVLDKQPTSQPVLPTGEAVDIETGSTKVAEIDSIVERNDAPEEVEIVDNSTAVRTVAESGSRGDSIDRDPATLAEGKPLKDKGAKQRKIDKGMKI